MRAPAPPSQIRRVNGYKRLNANPLAPKRVVWSHDNKGAMCRLVGGMGDPATHIENRSGEPAANPYLYMGSQIVAGLDGMANKIDPGSPLADPYAQTERPLMPAQPGGGGGRVVRVNHVPECAGE